MTLSPERLRSLLQRQRDTAQRLLGVLAEETAAISGNKLQDVETLLATKQQCLADLEASAQEYTELTQRPSPAGKPTMAAIMRACDPQGNWGLAPLWRQVETLLIQCRDKNSVNGKIIALGYRHVQQALSILRSGEIAAEPCYSPSGSRPAGGVSRTLGKV